MKYNNRGLHTPSWWFSFCRLALPLSRAWETLLPFTLVASERNLWPKLVSKLSHMPVISYSSNKMVSHYKLVILKTRSDWPFHMNRINFHRNKNHLEHHSSNPELLSFHRYLWKLLDSYPKTFLTNKSK